MGNTYLQSDVMVLRIRGRQMEASDSKIWFSAVFVRDTIFETPYVETRERSLTQRDHA